LWRVFLDHVKQDPAPAWRYTARSGPLGKLPRVAIRERPRNAAPRSLDVLPPEDTELLQGVVSGRTPLPVWVGVLVDFSPLRPGLLCVEALGNPAVLNHGTVLEHAAERHRRRGDPGLQPRRVEPVGVPRERGALKLHETDEGRSFITGAPWLMPSLVIQLSHSRDSIDRVLSGGSAVR